MGFGEEIFKYMAMRVEGGKGYRFPRFAGLDITRLRFPNTIDEDKGIFVAKYVFSGTRDEGEMCLNCPIGAFDFGCLDGKVSHAGGHFLEHAVEKAGVLCGSTGGAEL